MTRFALSPRNIMFMLVCVFGAQCLTEAQQIPSAAQSTPAAQTITPVAPGSTGNTGGAKRGTPSDQTLPAAADSTKSPTDEILKNLAHYKTSINLVWILFAGFLVMFMQAGFALIECGLCRAKNAAHVMAMNFMIYSLGILGFWICGYAIMFGGWGTAPVPIGWQPSLGQGLTLLNVEHSITLFGKPFGLWGGTGFFLSPSVFDTAVFSLFLFEVLFMDTTATIPTGAMAERWNFKNFVMYGFWVSMFGYTIFGNWVWGGGWLAQLGLNFDFGHGTVDFAGSLAVHMCGGMIALVGAWVLGPRTPTKDEHGRPLPFRAHNIPMAVLGTFILAFGWFGFNSGSTLAGTDHRIAIVAVNTMLASAAGAIAAALFMWKRVGTPEPTMMCNGMLAGLVAITAPCAFVNSFSAIIIGTIAGMLVVASAIFLSNPRLRIDDPVGAISVHCVCGFWGVISLGIFANGSYGAGWNGVHKLIKAGVVQIIHNDGTPATLKRYADLVATGWSDQGVTGLLGSWFGGAYDDPSQLVAQGIGALTCFLFVGALAWSWFKMSNRFVPIRSLPDDEEEGLDVGELRTHAYPYHRIDRH